MAESARDEARSSTTIRARIAAPRTFDAFRSRAFTLLWLNTLSFSAIQGIQRFAFVWLVLKTFSGGSSAAGFVTFALGIPVLFLSLPAGVISDRVDRRGLLLSSQIAAGAVMVVATALLASGAMTLALAFTMAAAIGATVAFGQPVRTAILPSLVPRERLMNAIVMSTMGQNVMMIGGPVLGGAVINRWGIEGAFAGQAVLYGLGFLVLLPLRMPPAEKRDGATRPLHEVGEGLAFVRGHREIMLQMVLLVVSGLLMMGPIFALLPQIAKDVLHKDALAASSLFGFVGIGMLATSLVLASLGNIANKGGWFVTSLVLGGLVVAGIGLSTSYVLTSLLMFFWGMGGGVFMNLNRTLIQSNTPQPLMGRVMSIYSMGLAGVAPIGGLLSGTIAGAIGAPELMVVAGAVLTAFSVFILISEPGLRRMS